jgi:hypothetical protein
MRELPVLKIDLKKPESFGNLAEKLDQSERRTLASDLTELIRIDENSMSEWAGRAEGYLDKAEKEGNPHPQDREQEGADEEAPPATEMTLSAVIQFSARATDALLGEPDLARASEPGGEPLASWVSSQLRTKDPHWTLDTDPMVMHMAVTGLAWRKRDFDDDERVFHSSFVPSVGGNKVIINANVRSVERAPRITHEFERYPYEIDRTISRGKWIDYDPRYDDADPQAPKKFYECDAWLDLDGDTIDEPWTLVISLDDHAEVVRIRPRWSKKTVVDNDSELFFNPIRRFYPYRMLPDPKGGFFPIGFGKLLDRMEDAADNLLGSIVDTAKSEAQNGGILSGGGFGLPDKIELKGNRITTIPTDGAKLSDHFQPFPAKSVSSGSVQVLTQLMTLGDRLAGTLNLMENAPASMTATLAKGIIDTGSQVQSAVHRRLVASMTQEFRMFVAMADAYDMLPEGLTASDGSGIAVTADPELATEMQRSALAGLYLQMVELGSKAPTFNVQEACLRFAQIMRLPDPEKLVAQPQAPQASPWEKMQGAVHLMKQQTEKIKVTGAVAVQLTQALKNMVEAAGGMQNNQMALLQMAQLEHAVQQLTEGAGNVGTGLDGMAQQPGNGGPPGAGAPPQGGNGPDLSGGGAGGPGAAG